MTDVLNRILELNDAGKYAGEIAQACNVSAGYVYKVLREYRPDRPRKPRKLVSDIPVKVLALSAEKYRPAQIAALCGCSRAYVYCILAREKANAQ